MKRKARTGLGCKMVIRARMPLLAGIVSVATILSVSACSQTEAKGYDISPVFPLSPNKCAKYGGKQEGRGFDGKCMVTKAECERAAQDWRNAMRQGGVSDGILFSCN